MKNRKKLSATKRDAAQSSLYELTDVQLATNDPTHSPMALVVMSTEPAVEGPGAEATQLTADALAKLEGGDAATDIATCADLLRTAQEKLAADRPEMAAKLGEVEQILREVLANAEVGPPPQEGAQPQAPPEEVGVQVEASLRRFAAGRVHSQTDMALINTAMKLLKALRARQKKAAEQKVADVEVQKQEVARMKAALGGDTGKPLYELVNSLAEGTGRSDDSDLTVDDKVKLSSARTLLYTVSGMLERALTDEMALMDPIGAVEKKLNEVADTLAPYAEEKSAELREKLSAFLTAVKAPVEEPPAEEVVASRESASAKPGTFKEKIKWCVRDTAGRKVRKADEPDFRPVMGRSGVLRIEGTAVLVEEGDRIDERTTATRAAVEGLAKTQRWRGARIEVEHPTQEEQESKPGGRVMAKAGWLVGDIRTRIASNGKAQAISDYVISSPDKVVRDFAVAYDTKSGSPYQPSYDTMCIGHIQKDADGSDRRYIDEFGEGFAMAIVVTGAYENATWNAREAAALKSTTTTPQKQENNMPKPADPNVAEALDRASIVEKAKGLARARMDGDGYTERERASAEQWINTTFTDTAEAKVFDEKWIRETMDTNRAKIAQPNKPSAPAVEVGVTDHDKAAMMVYNFFNPKTVKMGGGAGFRDMASAVIAAKGYTEDGKPYRATMNTVYHSLAGAGRVLKIYNEESSVYLEPDRRRFPYQPDPATRMREAQNYALANELGDSYPWGGNARDRAALTTAGLPLLTADALNKIAIDPLTEDKPGPGNPPDSVIVSKTIPVKDFRNIKLIETQHHALPFPMAEGAIYNEMPAITERQETFAAQYFGGLVTVTDHASRADDLGLLEKTPAEMILAALRRRRRTVWRIPRANPLMADGTALYAAGHANSNAAVYSFDELLNTAELLEVMVANSQGVTDEQEHTAQTVTDIVSSVGTKNAVLRDTLLDTQPDSAERGANAFVRAFGNVNVYHMAPWDTAGTTNRIVLIAKPFLVFGVLDGVEQPRIYVQDDPRVLSQNAKVFKVVDGHGVGIEHFRTSAAFI